MMTPVEQRLSQWARQLQRYGLADGVAMLLEATEPLHPLAEAFLAGGRFLFSPWASPQALTTLSTLLGDEATRTAFLQALHLNEGDPTS